MTKQPTKQATKKVTNNTNKSTKKVILKKDGTPAKLTGRPKGPMSEEAKYNRDTRDRVRKLTKITAAHMDAALTDLDTAKTVCTLIRATHEIHSSLFNGKTPNVAVQINNSNNGEKTNTEEVLKILQKKHKEIKND